ncbi:IS66 family transposase [Roseateles sp. GG27B]
MPATPPFTAQDLHGLSSLALTEVAQKLLLQIAALAQQITAQAQAIKLRDIKLERITFELARLKAWRFGAKTERMDAEQRQLFEETWAADQASLEAQLEALQMQPDVQLSTQPVPLEEPQARQQPKRQALPDHLRREVHRHELTSTTCDCGLAMVRVGEDVSEKLDIVPAEFFVHRHIRGVFGINGPASAARY